MNADPARAVRLVRVDGQLLRIHVRSGAPGRTPLLLVNGIGAGLADPNPPTPSALRTAANAYQRALDKLTAETGLAA